MDRARASPRSRWVPAGGAGALTAGRTARVDASAETLRRLAPLLDRSDPRRPALQPTAAARALTLVRVDVAAPVQTVLLRALCATRKVHLTALNVGGTADKLASWLQVRAASSLCP